MRWSNILLFHCFLLLLLFASTSFGQSVSLGADSTKAIDHDSTGYVEMHPLDIPDDRGLFVYSKDGMKAMRIFGSFRMLYVLDNRQQFQPYQVDPPLLPTGNDDFNNMNSQWTVNMSRLGIDVLFATKNSKGVMFRFELDWKGTDEAFRIRQLYMRTNNWIIGQTWNSFTALPYLPQTVGGHLTGAASGVRTPQIRYYNRTNNWHYQVSLEFKNSTLIKPDTIQAVGRVLIPALVGRFSYKGDFGQVGAAAMIKPNRVQFTGDLKEVQQIVGFGANVGLKYILKQRNRILFGAYGGTGMGSYIVDFAYKDIELIYNPYSREFENMSLFGGFLAYERDWSKTLTSTFAFGYNNTVNKYYQEALAFHYSYKNMVNLFYRAKNKLEGFVVGVEMLYAERFNKDDSSNMALRGSVIMFYDF